MPLSHWASAPDIGTGLGHPPSLPRAGNLAGLPGHFLSTSGPQAGPCTSVCSAVQSQTLPLGLWGLRTFKVARWVYAIHVY